MTPVNPDIRLNATNGLWALGWRFLPFQCLSANERKMPHVPLQRSLLWLCCLVSKEWLLAETRASICMTMRITRTPISFFKINSKKTQAPKVSSLMKAQPLINLGNTIKRLMPLAKLLLQKIRFSDLRSNIIWEIHWSDAANFNKIKRRKSKNGAMRFSIMTNRKIHPMQNRIPI